MVDLKGRPKLFAVPREHGEIIPVSSEEMKFPWSHAIFCKDVEALTMFQGITGLVGV